MKPNVIVVLLVGLVLGFAVGKVVTGSRQEAPTIVAAGANPAPTANAVAGESESNLAIKSSDMKANTFAGMTDAQKYAAMKVMNENDCDCGCANDTLAECAKKDPSCPLAPAKLAQAVDLAKAGKNASEIQMQMFGHAAKSGAPRPPAQEATMFKVPIEGSPAHGKSSALVTMVEISDYQCPFCSRADGTVEQLQKEYGDKLRVVMKQNPLPMHENANAAALAALAAGEQGKYWEMHRSLFAHQQALDGPSLEKYAKEIGLDVPKWKQAMANSKLQEVIRKDQSLATSIGATGTPAFFINGRKLSGAQPIENFKRVIDEEFAKAESMVKEGVPSDQVYAKIMEKSGSAPPSPSAAPSAAPQPSPAVPTAAKKVEIPADSPSRGPKNAKVTLVEFSDFQCPFCSRFTPTLKQIEEKYGKDVRVVFRHQPLPFHNNAKLAAEASMAANAQGKFWPYHDKLFANQQALDRPSLEKYASELGIDMAKFTKALDSGQFRSRVEADSSAGSALGASGTPTFFLNGRQIVGAQPFESFKAMIDEEIKRANKLLAAGTKPDKLYDKLQEQAAALPAPGSAPAAAAVQKISIVSAPVKGPKNAPVTIVEFSDFQCPFCGRAIPTLKAIEEGYGSKVKIAFKQQPLPFHQNARPAAAASLAAHEQGKFWEYHDKLFANQQALDRASLEKYAQEIGLNVQKFKAALDSNKFEKQIAADSEEGSRAGAQGTPTFFINGRSLVGAQPLEAFKSIIDEELKKAGKPAPAAPKQAAAR